MEEQIPKILHLVWFGRNPYSKIVNYCLESWKKYCPDYEIMIWNEDSFDINSNQWAKEAYEAKKYAFVSDYVRLYALYNYGGIYLDTDVELIDNIDFLLSNEAFSGYSSDFWLNTAFMGSVKGNLWIKILLEYYNDRHFKNKDGNLETAENNQIITKQSVEKCNFMLGDRFIDYGHVVLYDEDVFQPYKKCFFDLNSEENLNHIHDFYDIKDGKTISIHHFTASWDDSRNGILFKIKAIIRKRLPRKYVENLRKIYYKIFK